MFGKRWQIQGNPGIADTLAEFLFPEDNPTPNVQVHSPIAHVVSKDGTSSKLVLNLPQFTATPDPSVQTWRWKLDTYENQLCLSRNFPVNASSSEVVNALKELDKNRVPFHYLPGLENAREYFEQGVTHLLTNLQEGGEQGLFRTLEQLRAAKEFEGVLDFPIDLREGIPTDTVDLLHLSYPFEYVVDRLTYRGDVAVKQGQTSLRDVQISIKPNPHLLGREFNNFPFTWIEGTKRDFGHDKFQIGALNFYQGARSNQGLFNAYARRDGSLVLSSESGVVYNPHTETGLRGTKLRGLEEAAQWFIKNDAAIMEVSHA